MVELACAVRVAVLGGEVGGLGVMRLCFAVVLLARIQRCGLDKHIYRLFEKARALVLVRRLVVELEGAGGRGRKWLG